MGVPKIDRQRQRWATALARKCGVTIRWSRHDESYFVHLRGGGVMAGSEHRTIPEVRAWLRKRGLCPA